MKKIDNNHQKKINIYSKDSSQFCWRDKQSLTWTVTEMDATLQTARQSYKQLRTPMSVTENSLAHSPVSASIM